MKMGCPLTAVGSAGMLAVADIRFMDVSRPTQGMFHVERPPGAMGQWCACATWSRAIDADPIHGIAQRPCGFQVDHDPGLIPLADGSG